MPDEKSEPTKPLPVLRLDLRRKRQERYGVLVAAAALFAWGAAVLIMTDDDTGFLIGMGISLAAFILYVLGTHRLNQTIEELENQVAWAQADLPPGTSASEGIKVDAWVALFVGVGGIAATIIAALIGKN